MKNQSQSCYNISTFEKHCQHLRTDFVPTGEVLYDVAPDGKERPWVEKKTRNMQLAQIYADINPSKEGRLVDCGRFLEFRLYSDGSKKLHSMTSCRVRLCPICAWRRSLKTFYNNLKIINFLKEKHNYQFVFLTLTVRNCNGDELRDTMDEIDRAVHRLYQRDEWSKVVKGACRCVEVTHNVNPNSKWYNTYHPHIHFMLAVNKSYFTDKTYLSHEKWVELWQSVLHADYRPIVDIRKCYGTDAKAVAECSKYSTKDTEYIIPDNWQLSVETVKLLDEVLAHRRLLTYTGCFRAAKAILKLEDEENGSLVNVGEPEEEIQLDYTTQTYCWYTGYKQYVSID